MMTRDFHQRPTAQQALEHLCQVKSSLSSNIARLRLRRPDASVSDTVVYAVADGIVNLAWLFDGEVGWFSLLRNNFSYPVAGSEIHEHFVIRGSLLL